MLLSLLLARLVTTNPDTFFDSMLMLAYAFLQDPAQNAAVPQLQTVC
jgi:hypothetical protein